VEFVGPVVSVQGVGAIVSGLLCSRVIRRIGEPASIVAGLSLLVVGLLGIAGAVRIWQLLAATVVLGAGLPLLIVAYNTLLQKQTPGHLMGRVSTTTEVLITTPQAVSIATGALLVTLLDYRVIFLLMAVGAAVAAAYLAVALRGRLGVVETLAPAAVIVGAAAGEAVGAQRETAARTRSTNS
jgi:MFS family permease